MKRKLQVSLFDYDENYNLCTTINGKNYDTDVIIIPEETINRLHNYNLDYYKEDIETVGLEKTWDLICQFVIENSKKLPLFLDLRNFGELYEIGLAIQDKLLKKKSGQYYTPSDVAKLMSEWLLKCDGKAVCDVACGTGKLILTYLDLLGYDKARELISSGNLYLYDFDNVALKICRTTIAVKYGLDIANSINDIFCDFLDSKIKLPKNAKVISNPPYAKIEKMQSYWKYSDVMADTKELYSAFMEKIFDQAQSTVIITPFSFISGTKFYSLRKKMCELGNGIIVSFDNVPGNIFCGRKHGVFNTNTANSVRAAITVLNKSKSKKGFRVSPLIRFKNDERKKLLCPDILEKTLPAYLQIVTDKKKQFEKVEKNLEEIYYAWINKSRYTMKELLCREGNELIIDMPNTCRYYTTGSSRKLSRTGSITMHFNNKIEYNFAYCMINSSFAYWWWRIYDGGINYPVSLLTSLPMPINLLNEEDNKFFDNMAEEMRMNESRYIIIKMNAGVPQENIKFPDEYRRKINKRMLEILGFNCSDDVFNSVHENCFLGRCGYVKNNS